jgi:acetylornithine deacetylase/succinyl-diaminopimelate desuccinylase-like protein
MFNLEQALLYARENQAEFISSLKQFLKIPSLSRDEGDPQAIQQAATWLKQKLSDTGFEKAQIFETAMHPMVFAENLSAGPEALTVLIYGHYDVQSPKPLEDWQTPPFDPTIKGENLYARGASDNKGEVILSISAIESILQAGTLPINVKVLFEGEEEIGSRNMRDFLKTHKDMLDCDFCLNLDGGMAEKDHPGIIYGLRGAVTLILKITGAEKDLHSGLYGGLVLNPIHVLARLISKLQDEQGRIQLPGFYDSVRPVTAKEKELIAQSPKNEAYYLREIGTESLWGDPSIAPLERCTAMPTLDVALFQSGQVKMAIPSTAKAFITMRIVPDQDPDAIYEQLLKFIAENIPDPLTWEIVDHNKGPAVLVNYDTPYVELMSSALEAVWGRPPVFARIGGGIPIVAMLSTELGVDSIITGITLPDDNLHGPNEKIHLPTWEKGLEAVIRFFHSLSAV